MKIEIKQLEHEAKMYCLNNRLETGTERRALIFGFVEWLKNKRKMECRCSECKPLDINQTCQNCKYVKKHYKEFPCDGCLYQDKWEKGKLNTSKPPKA